MIRKQSVTTFRNKDYLQDFLVDTLNLAHTICHDFLHPKQLMVTFLFMKIKKTHLHVDFIKLLRHATKQNEKVIKVY